MTMEEKTLMDRVREFFSKEGFKAFCKQALEVLKKRWWVILIELAVLAIILLLDLLSKKYVTEFLFGQPAYSYKLIPGVLHLEYSENTGAGFSLFSNNTTALIAVTFVVVIALTFFLIFAQKQSEWLRISLIFIVGGGIGNLVDRLALGYVRDFIVYAFIKNFAVCNIADAFVTVGAVMLVIVLIVMMVKESLKNKKEFEKEQAAKAQAGVEETGTDPLDAPLNLNPMLISENEFDIQAPIETESPRIGDIQAPIETESPRIGDSQAPIGAESPKSGDNLTNSEEETSSVEEIREAEESEVVASETSEEKENAGSAAETSEEPEAEHIHEAAEEEIPKTDDSEDA